MWTKAIAEAEQTLMDWDSECGLIHQQKDDTHPRLLRESGCRYHALLRGKFIT